MPVRPGRSLDFYTPVLYSHTPYVVLNAVPRRAVCLPASAGSRLYMVLLAL